MSELEEWLRLRAAQGPRITVIDLYRLAGERRGLAPHELPVEERAALAAAAAPHIWPGFETMAGSWRNDPLRVVDYDAAWPAVFASWRDRIAAALGPVAERIEHVGSTSVPGLAAKPTVDIQVSVPELEDEPAYLPHLERTHLRLRTRDLLHRYFRPPAPRPREVHVHVCESGSEWEAVHLRFRDRLRRDADARERYAAVKWEAARIWADDRWGYTETKTAVILDILDEAQAAGEKKEGERRPAPAPEDVVG